MPRGSTGIYNYPNTPEYDENYDRVFRSRGREGIPGGVVKPAPRRFRKKPVVIEAIQYTGVNILDVQAFAGADVRIGDDDLGVMTLEGFKPLPVGYWVIKGVKGEFYPVEPEIFAMTYEEAE